MKNLVDFINLYYLTFMFYIQVSNLLQKQLRSRSCFFEAQSYLGAEI